MIAKLEHNAVAARKSLFTRTPSSEFIPARDVLDLLITGRDGTV
jgi:hypothetical protein